MKNANWRKITAFMLLILMVVTVLLSSCSTARKEKQILVPTPKENVYVYDEDNIVDDNIEKELNALLTKLEEQTKAEVVVVTIPSLNDKEIEDYSYELANTLGIGKEKEDNGVLLLISKSDSRVRLEIGKGLEGCLNDSKCGRILDDYFVPYREKEEYSEGTKKTIEAVVSVIAKEYETTIGDIDASVADELEEEYSDNWVVLIICLVALLILAAIVSGAISSGTYSGGSFRSGGGGSSFGGFGGGSFGGGGASR